MSFNVPSHAPNFNAPQRRYEDAYWSSSGHTRHAVTNGINISPFAFRGPGKELPMYKDKPYNYPAPRRKSSKRLIALMAAFTIVAWWVLWPKYGSSASIVRANVPGAFSAKSKGDRFYNNKRAQVVTAMEKSWSAYEKHAWGFDEYHPNSKAGRQMVPPTGLGWIIVDALDTLMLMNLTSQLKHAREWIATTLTYELDHDVNTFETTIRMLGGFLGAHYLQTAYPYMCPVDLKKGGDDLYLEKATDLAERVLGAFDSPSGVPYSSINLKQMKGIPSHDGGAASLAEATSVQLEFKYLANLTGEANYWEKVEKVMKVVDETGETDGLKGIYVNVDSGAAASHNIRLGSRGDSYYEYLLKQYYQTHEPIYLHMWNESLTGIKKHLITYSSPSNFTVLAERPSGLHADLSPKMDHLACFLPGTIALGTTGGVSVAQAKKNKQWTADNEQDLALAVELMKTCWGMYRITKTGLAPEITYFNLHQQPIMYNDKDRPNPPPMDIFTKDSSEEAPWRHDFVIKPADTHNLQRPETVESLFYMWRITGDDIYREWGAEMFDAFMKYTEVADGGGFTSIQNVNEIPPRSRDNMESFWPAETLKYFYLLFSPTDFLPLDTVVFNTEAHPLPRFKPGKLLKTGWARRPRDSHGMVIKEVEAHDQVVITKKVTPTSKI